jgi:chromosome segregation ATPase
MIEPIMYFGIGFLVAALGGLVIVPLVHGRAVRLTMRRLEAATPLSMAEIQADKDQLRADFAMSTRRLEMSIEQLQTQNSSHLAELGKKSDAINRLKIEIGEKTAAIFALEAHNNAVHDQLNAAGEEVAMKTAAIQEAERMLSGKQAELAKVLSELDERAAFVDAQNGEILSLNEQIEALKGRLAAAAYKVKVAEDRREAERVQLREAVRELDEERGKVQGLGRRVGGLEQQLATQIAEAQILGRRAHDLETRLMEQSRLLTRIELERKHAVADVQNARQIEDSLRAAIAELDNRANAANAKLKEEKAHLLTELERTKDERDRLSRNLATLKRETDEAWASERTENALLRDRISDVAAEVARLASALEGPNSPIDAILAAETARDRINGAATASDVEMADATGRDGNLADRIRALRTRTSHGPNEPESKVRN